MGLGGGGFRKFRVFGLRVKVLKFRQFRFRAKVQGLGSLGFKV